MRDYSSRHFRCKWCRKLLKGYVPKGGDGTGFLLPKHKGIILGQTCDGWGQLMDIGEAERAEGEKGEGNVN